MVPTDLRIRTLNLVLSVGFTICLAVSSSARPVGPWSASSSSPAPPTRFGQIAPDFQAALDYSEQGLHSQSISEFESILAVKIGSELEPQARLLLANEYYQAAIDGYGDPLTLQASYQAQLNTVAQNFPDTTHSFMAQVMLFESSNDSEFGLDTALAGVGAPTIAQVLDESPDSPFHERVIAEPYRNLVADAYGRVGTRLSDSEQAKLSIFVHQSFPYSTMGLESSFDHYRNKAIPPTSTWNGVPSGYTGPDTTAPSLVSRYPSPGEHTSNSPNIRIAIGDGGKFARQLAPESCVLKLDGVEMMDQIFWEFVPDVTGQGPHFEKWTIALTPSAPLSPGPHNLELYVADQGLDPNSTIYSWSFIVDPLIQPEKTSSTPEKLLGE